MAMVPVITLFEPLSECMVIGGCAAWAVSVLFKWDSLGFYLIHILLWFISDWILLSIVQVNHSSHFLNNVVFLAGVQLNKLWYLFSERIVAVQQVRLCRGLAVPRVLRPIPVAARHL